MTRSRLRLPDCYRPLWWWLESETPPARYFCLSGGRASGKSTAVAQSLVCHASVTPMTVLCTREFQNSLDDSVIKLLAEQIEELHLTGFTILRDRITHDNGSLFIFRGLHDNVQSIKSIQSIDVSWVEEAQTVSMDSLDVLIPTVRNADSRIIFTWNPLTRHDAVMRKFVDEATPEIKKATWHVHTTWRDVEEFLNASVLQMVEEAKGTPEFAHVWEGQPLADSAMSVMSWQQLQQAEVTQAPADGVISFGVDVARLGADRTAVAVRKGDTLVDLVSWQHTRITESAERIKALADQWCPVDIRVDDCGVGGGLTDLLLQSGLPVVPVNSAGKAKESAKYPNANSELWFEFASKLASGDVRILSTLADKPSLFSELSMRTWTMNTKNQRVVQAKSDYKATNSTGSPDLADATLLAFYSLPRLTSWNVDVV